MEISFFSSLNSNKVIAIRFCPCHDSSALVACAKFCRDLIIINCITTLSSNLYCGWGLLEAFYFSLNSLNYRSRSFESRHSCQVSHRQHDDVIKWKHFPRYWSFVRGIHRSPVNSPHKGQWRGALMFTLICARINGWVNNREADDLRRYRAHYDVIVMKCERDFQ